MWPYDRSDTRTRPRLLLGAFLGGFLYLWIMVGRVQLVEAEQYTSHFLTQVTRRICLPAPRGRMFDRNGYCLAANAPTYCICIHPEEICDPRWSRTRCLDALQEVILRLGAALGRERFYDAPDREDIERHLSVCSVMPLLIWTDVDVVTMARWAERNTEFPGVDIVALARRHYYLGSKGALFRGAVGRCNPEQNPERPYNFCLPDMVGLWGIEKALNQTLTGTAGERVISVDVLGYTRSIQSEMPPIPGNDVVLTMDIRLQCLAEQALDAVRGAIIIMDPNTGEILAMASSPSVRLGASSDEWVDYVKDDAHPMLDRCAVGCYAPGSVFKPVIALAALNSGLWDPETIVHCPGYHQVGNRRVRCWNRSGHGPLNLRQAIEQSCNAYFCAMAEHCGVDVIHDQAAKLGFGALTGIGPPIAESAGILPGPAWKRQTHGAPWTGGDTCNLAIGQGALSVTVLQMGAYISALANGGVIYKPRLVLDGMAPEIASDMRWAPQVIALIRAGMEDVIHGERGTAKAARLSDVRMCGKTGTAEVGPRDNRRKNAWMCAFAPADAPRYAVAMIVEDGESGGRTAAPRLKRLMEGVFSQEIVPEMEVFAHVGIGRKLDHAN